MARVFLDRAWMTTATTGTGTITLGSVVSADYFTFAEAGIADADTAYYVIIDGTDVEIGLGTYTASGTTFSRDTVLASKVSGTAGTSKLNLSGSATIYVTETGLEPKATFAQLRNQTANSVLARAAATTGAVSGVALSASQLIGRGSTGDVAAISVGTGLSFSGTTLNAAGSKLIAVFRPRDNEPPSSNYATLDTRNGHDVLDFDATTQEAAIFSGVIPSHYGTSGLTLQITASLTSATTGTLGWVAGFERIDAGTLDIDADSFASDQTGTAATVPGTSGVTMTHTITFSNSQIDGLVAGDPFRLRIRRDVTNDTATGDAEFIIAKLEMQ